MRKIFILLSLFTSFSAFADMNCLVKTYQDSKHLNTHILKSETGTIRSGHLAELHKIRERMNHKVTLYLYGTLSGWQGEEFLEAVIYKNDLKFATHNDNFDLTEKFLIKDKETHTFEVEAYTVNIRCQKS